MNFSDSERLELSELCSALVDGFLTEAQRARLAEMLAQSEEARRFYVRSMALSASLFDYAAEMQSEPAETSFRALSESPATRWWGLGALAAAAAIALAFWLGGAEKRTTGDAPFLADVDADESVARLSGGKEIRWIGEAPALGDELRRGQQIKLASGFAEITFDSGAEIILEGPASLELNSAWDAVLHGGTLKAKVPPEAIGFRIANSDVDVVDLGTEFSMVAEENGGTEVFVTKGSVEAAAHETGGRRTAPVTLREKQASRFARNGVSDVRNREQKLARLLRKVAFERAAGPADYVQWSFNETSGSTAHAILHGLEMGDRKSRGAGLHSPLPDLASAAHDLRFDARLESSAGEPWIAGRWENGLHLDGANFARASFPKLGKRAAHTVTFWARVPADAPLAEAGAMLAWQLPGKSPRLAVLGWNADPTLGALGALRTNAGRFVRVGTTSLRDGQWHHLAVIVPSSGRADAKFQIKSYVDGRLEG
ncbi:MAG: hypothetical protein ABI883_06445, partial [Chthoniobacterales bacterium]